MATTQVAADWSKEWFEIEDATYLNTAAHAAIPRVALRAVQTSRGTYESGPALRRKQRPPRDVETCWPQSVSWHYDFEFNALAFFQRFPRGILQWKFSLSSDDLVPRLPLQEMGHGRSASACSGRERDFFRFRPNHFRERRPNSDWSFEEDGVVHVMRKLVGFN